ncbi:MAG: acyltransferase [Clostridiales bacterium]|nr:acyltransferase [Clostridiales bacterium]
MEAIKKKQYGMIDVAKFLCALLILVYHYFSEHGPIFWLFEEMLSLYAIGVALFMIISGFLTYRKLELVEGTKERWTIIKKQVVRILKIYLLWSVPYIIYQVCKWDFANINLSFVFWKIQSWVFSSTFYTIWFMPALAIGTILSFWLLEKAPRVLTYILAIICYILGALQLTYSFVLESVPFWNDFINFSSTWLGGARGWLFFAFPLTTLGRCIVRCKDKVKPLPFAIFSVLTVGLILLEGILLRYFVGGTGIDLTMSMPLAVACILCFLISVDVKSSPCLVWMRKMSVLIFMSQRLFLTVLVSFLPLSVYNVIFSNVYLGAIIICGATVILSAGIIQLSKKIKCLKSLY